ncbi:MAG TPA: DUF3332 family protein [Kofleriaceae bacterium]|nr:DUF3332 family protein [Kofleriaceae bacterium]
MKKLLAPLVLSAVLSGCYGSYSASHALHKANGHIGSPIANSAVHLVLWIIPVYPIVYFGDFLIFNNIEFLTNKPVFN